VPVALVHHRATIGHMAAQAAVAPAVLLLSGNKLFERKK
jgi:hypothetical protein